MRKTMTAILGLLCLTVLAGDSEAGLFCHRHKAKVTYRYSAGLCDMPHRELSRHGAEGESADRMAPGDSAGQYRGGRGVLAGPERLESETRPWSGRVVVRPRGQGVD